MGRADAMGAGTQGLRNGDAKAGLAGNEGGTRLSGCWWAPDDYTQDYGVSHGSAHSVSSDGPEQDAAEQVRQIAEEVTGKVIERAERRIGFV